MMNSGLRKNIYPNICRLVQFKRICQVAYWVLMKLPILSLCCVNASAYSATVTSADQSRVITDVKKSVSYIEKNGIEKAITHFKNFDDIFIGNYNGMFFVSPLHPELIRKNQFNYKDSSGTLVVQEEINKAKAGGGWLTGRWRKNSLTGKYQCRKIYILPVAGSYFVGSWYHYSSNKQGICLI